MSARAASVRRWLLAALLIGAALPAHAAAQQPCRGAGAWRVASVAPANISFSTPTALDYDRQGIEYAAIVTVNVTSSRRGTPLVWTLCVNADTPDLGSSEGFTKPLSDLQIELLDGNWRPLTSTQQQILTGSGDAVVQMRVRFRLSWDTDPPGNFGTILRVTVGS